MPAASPAARRDTASGYLEPSDPFSTGRPKVEIPLP